MYFCSTIVYKKIILRTKIVCMDKQVVVRSSITKISQYRLLNASPYNICTVMAILKLLFIGVVSNFTMGLFWRTYFAPVSRAVSYQPIKEVMATLKQSGSINVSGEG